MKILITAATEHELLPLKQQINCENNKAVVAGNTIRLAVTGVGTTITTYNLTKLLQGNGYDLVLNAGIAGSFSDDIAIGETVVVEREIFADWGVFIPNGFRTVFEEGIVRKAVLPFNSDGELCCRHIAPYTFLKNYKKVKAITVNAASGEPVQIEALQNKFTPDIESMEGAAFFYVCMMENIPFLEIRSISNKVEKRDKSRWNIPLSVNNLADTVLSFLRTL